MSEPIFEKVCSACGGDPQPIENFYRKKKGSEARSCICKICAIARAKAWATAHPEEVLARVATWQKDNAKRKNENTRRWRQKSGYDTSDHARKLSRDRRARQRKEAIVAMGGQCECCGLVAEQFICFDHIGGWGVAHRKIVHASNLPLWLKKHDYPKGDGTVCECGEIHQGVRLLCYDCNMSIALSPDGTCAHKETPEESRRKRIEIGGTARAQRYAREWRVQLRDEIFAAYGSKCYCCSQADERFLCIDHPGNWGRDHRQELGSGNPIFAWLKKHHFPKGNEICPACGVKHKAVRLACFNCNMAAGKSESGKCPHEEFEVALAA